VAEKEEKENDPFDYNGARKTLKRLRMLKSLQWHRRMEDGKMRATLELKVGA